MHFWRGSAQTRSASRTQTSSSADVRRRSLRLHQIGLSLSLSRAIRVPDEVADHDMNRRHVSGARRGAPSFLFLPLCERERENHNAQAGHEEPRHGQDGEQQDSVVRLYARVQHWVRRVCPLLQPGTPCSRVFRSGQHRFISLETIAGVCATSVFLDQHPPRTTNRSGHSPQCVLAPGWRSLCSWRAATVTLLANPTRIAQSVARAIVERAKVQRSQSSFPPRCARTKQFLRPCCESRLESPESFLLVQTFGVMQHTLEPACALLLCPNPHFPQSIHTPTHKRNKLKSKERTQPSFSSASAKKTYVHVELRSEKLGLYYEFPVTSSASPKQFLSTNNHTTLNTMILLHSFSQGNTIE